MDEATRMRVGTGFDVHALVKGRPLVLCGVHVSSELGLEGHSDGDVAAHAVIDALLGAAGEGDLGTEFGTDEAGLAGADSMQLLQGVARRLIDAGFSIINVDLTIALQQPTLSEQRQPMRSALAVVLGVAVERVSVKVTTTDRLGFVGRSEGAAAYASCLLLAPAGGSGGQ